MNISIDRSNHSSVAIVRSEQPLIVDPKSALELITTVHYETGCDKLIVDKSALAESFFDLRSGLAGEVLQKCMNYQIKLAIVGDFSGYPSKSLQALIVESNRGNDFFFVPTEEIALAKLHGVRSRSEQGQA